MFRFGSVDIFLEVRQRAKTSRGATLRAFARAPLRSKTRGLSFFEGAREGNHFEITPLDFGFKICFNFVSTSSFKAKGSKLS